MTNLLAQIEVTQPLSAIADFKYDQPFVRMASIQVTPVALLVDNKYLSNLDT